MGAQLEPVVITRIRPGVRGVGRFNRAGRATRLPPHAGRRFFTCPACRTRQEGRAGHQKGNSSLSLSEFCARRTDTPTRHTRKAGDRLKAGWAGTLARLIERHFRAWEGGKAGFGCGPLQDIASGHGEPAPVSFGRRTRSGSLRASRGLCSGRYKMGAKRREEAAGRGSEVRSGWAIPQRSSRS